MAEGGALMTRLTLTTLAATVRPPDL